MSYSLAVVNGDLAMAGGQLQIVHGVAKLKQEIDLWVRERYGIDRFHTTFGSTLENYIGQVVTDDTQAEIAYELTRVLRNLQAVTLRALKENPQKYSLSELPMDILSVNAKVTYDTVYASLTVVNGERAPVTTKTSNTTVGA